MLPEKRNTLWSAGDILPIIYGLAGVTTTIYLTLFDGYIYNAWNWLIAIPVNIFLGMIWPVYWGFLRWVM